MEGGELFSRIQERADQAFTERGQECLVMSDWLCVSNLNALFSTDFPTELFLFIFLFQL